MPRFVLLPTPSWSPNAALFPRWPLPPQKPEHAVAL